eukprot:14918556-Alexandrium_andersonii.AAC.1
MPSPWILAMPLATRQGPKIERPAGACGRALGGALEVGERATRPCCAQASAAIGRTRQRSTNTRAA